MGRKLRFGVMTLQTASWNVLVDRWQVLDRSRFDSAWVADHYTMSSPSHVLPSFEAWTLLAALAAQTHRIRLGPMVTSMTFRNPAMLAKQAMTLDHVSNGRLELGIGAGGSPLDHAATGTPQWEPKERAARFREYVEIVDRLLREETTTYAGTFYQTEGALVHPASVQRPRPPLTIAALGPTTIRLAARFADTWNSYIRPPLDAEGAFNVTKERIARLEEACAEIGRNPADISRSLLCWPWMPDTPLVSLQAFRDFVGRYAEAGIDEFIFYWSREDFIEHGGGPALMERSLDRAMLDWLQAEAIPAVRADRGEDEA